MEYTIQQLSNLAGVSTRTLRWYDEVGLLPPLRVGENGYRIYGPEEVDRLQLILFYRAMGMELRRIGEILDAPNFDRLAALRSHLSELEKQEAKITLMIESVKETILSAERNEIMTDKEKFKAFKKGIVDENEAQYGKEAREKYGNGQVDAANANIMGLKEHEFTRWSELDKDILAKLEQAVTEGFSPEGEVGKELTALHLEWLSFSIKGCSPAQQKGIAQLYVCDERFTAYYDKKVPGCAAFLTAAVSYWAK